MKVYYQTPAASDRCVGPWPIRVIALQDTIVSNKRSARERSCAQYVMIASIISSSPTPVFLS